MTIPSPQVDRDESCEILIGTKWRPAVVKGLEWTNHHGSFGWAYYVQVKSLTGTVYRRWACDDSIRKVKE